LSHCPKIREAVWLFLYLLDKQTRETDKNGNGKVLHGVPIRDKDIEGALGQSRFTIVRWRRTLRQGGYIAALRTPYGFVYSIAKPKKWQERCDKNATSLTASDVQNRGERCAESGVEMCDSATNKEDVTGITDVAVVKAATTADRNSKMEDERPSKSEYRELLSIWNYYLDAFCKEEAFTASRIQYGLARLRELAKGEGRALRMTAAIDVAKNLSRSKPYFADWYRIFGKAATFESLVQQYDESPTIQEAATLEPVTLP
jgi:hypothetical protein